MGVTSPFRAALTAACKASCMRPRSINESAPRKLVGGPERRVRESSDVLTSTLEPFVPLIVGTATGEGRSGGSRQRRGRRLDPSA